MHAPDPGGAFLAVSQTPAPAARDVALVALAATAPAATSADAAIPTGLLVLVALVFAALLVAAALALVPAHMVPREVEEAMAGRRGDLVFTSLCGLGVVLLLVLFGVVASS